MGNAWRDTRNIDDLGRNMALWLEGRGTPWPGYLDTFVDDETRHLLPTLIDLNRAGFLTTNSQPGLEGRGYDGAHWRQKAYLEGVIDSRSALLGRVMRASQAAGLIVIRGTRRPSCPVPFTDRNGEPVAGISAGVPRNQLSRDWHGIGRQALRELRKYGARLTVVDPVWGRDDRLWPALAGVVR
ncbi:DUF6919 domain-containing protein [Streptomyces vietnamensis]|uniref:DUF6919 domain-containing protein n=1 Tax=Streptomyces vietnamensis TaxID=362257 RepID=UPI0037A39916